MKTIQFTLSMPNVGSWNGQWSGAANLYARVRRFTDTSADKIMSHGSYYYNFGDGWGASVSVKQIDGAEARRVSRASKGFCGYDWMIDSIVMDGAIYGPTRPKPAPVGIPSGEVGPFSKPFFTP